MKAPAPKQIRCPSEVPEGLKKKWKELAKELADLGLFSRLDYDTLTRYVLSQAQWHNATAQVAKYMSRKDVEGASDWASLQDKFYKQARNAANDMGLTVTSRCKLVIPKVEEKQDSPFLTLIQSRTGTGG